MDVAQEEINVRKIGARANRAGMIQCLQNRKKRFDLRGPYPGFFIGEGGWVGAHLNNRDQVNNVGMIGHASVEDTRLLGGSRSGDNVPQNNFEII